MTVSDEEMVKFMEMVPKLDAVFVGMKAGDVIDYLITYLCMGVNSIAHNENMTPDKKALMVQALQAKFENAVRAFESIMQGKDAMQ